MFVKINVFNLFLIAHKTCILDKNDLMNSLDRLYGEFISTVRLELRITGETKYRRTMKT